jgi:predicted DNA binding CopG/RHH family protein
MRPVQYFSDEYLQQCKGATPEQILEFLEQYRLMQARPAASKLISIKIPEPLLQAFRQKCEIEGVKYQTRIKQLMQEWLDGGA